MSTSELFIDSNEDIDFRYETDDGAVAVEYTGQSIIDTIWENYITALDPVLHTAVYRKYKFQTFYHPRVCAMIKQLNRYGIDGLLNPKPDSEEGKDLLRQLATESTFDFEATYAPEKGIVQDPFPEENFDFDSDGPYGLYNWELFFHAPMLIATKLTQNQKFEDAQKWLHYIFNPTETNKENGVETIPAPQRFWKVKPFFEFEGENDIEAVLEKMASGNVQFNLELNEWMKNPFQPHAVARLRVVAYMKSVVMKYLDNLIKWGDSLFRMDTIESLNEATQLYILASQILGDKPVSIDKESTPAKTVEDVMMSPLFNSALIDMESEIGDIETDYSPDTGEGVNGLNSLLYFCTSPNDKLLGYWDTVADRLFKIRHCMNIEGVTRSLALFQPPIDPALLVKASAAGLSIGSVLGNISGANLPNYRFRVLVQKANEICNDVKSLGQSLLSALEKKDAEELSLLRASQEINLLKAIREIKKQAIEEGKEGLASLEMSKELAQTRLEFYSSREYMNKPEKEQLKRMDNSLTLQLIDQNLNVLGAALATIPDLKAGIAGAFGSPNIQFGTGGNTTTNIAVLASQTLRTLSAIEQNKASKSGIRGGYDRRKDDWDLQADLATTEIEQINAQIAAAEIRLAMSERELENHDMQTEQSREVEAFMKDKYTNRDLYNWMITQISGMYFQSYQLAYDVARMAQQAYNHELAVQDASFIQFGHWDSLKRGLLAGDKLQADLRRMEVAYLEQNKREYEITKHIPLSLVAPEQLVFLREDGACDIQLPEVLFDLDHPGQYMRRIKSVRVTIPGVTGPYTNVSAKLTLMSNRTRTNTNVSEGYAYSPGNNDDSFRLDVGGIQSIATSSAQNDSGTFELNFQDERYLPFEGSGAVSAWRLELTGEFRPFDYDTISDVILHMSYTAREGGSVLRSAAIENIEAGLNLFADELAGSNTGMQRVFSLKTHFPNALYDLLSSGSASFDIGQEHFAHFLKGKTLELMGDLSLFIKPKDSFSGAFGGNATLDVGGTNLTTSQNLDESGDLATVTVSGPSSADVVDTWSLSLAGGDFTFDSVEDIYLVINHSVSNS